MPHTTSKGKNVYSVDLIFAYINIFKPKITKINLSSINYDMNYSKEHTYYNNIITKRSTIYNFELNKKYYIYKICYRW